MSGQDQGDISRQGECQHPEETLESPDPGTGKVFCGLCGAEVFDQSLQVGGRLVPPAELLRRVAGRRRELEKEMLEKIQELHRLDATVAQVRDVRCAWPGCQVPPRPGSRWCPAHKEEHRKENARERQRRKRRGLKDTIQGGGYTAKSAPVMKPEKFGIVVNPDLANWLWELVHVAHRKRNAIVTAP